MNNLNLIVRIDIILNNSCTDYLISYEVVRDSYSVYVSSTVLTQNNVINNNALVSLFAGALLIIDRWEGSVHQCVIGSPVLLATVTVHLLGKSLGFRQILQKKD